jgi:hypothetical protein
MNWDAIGAIAESLGAIGVIATLLYLSVQIRQNTRALEDTKRLSIAPAYERRAQMAHDSILQLRDSANTLEALTKFNREGPDNLTDIERARVIFDQIAAWERLDNAYKQRQLGFLDDEYFEDFESMVESSLRVSQLLGMDELAYVKPGLRKEVKRIMSQGKSD